MSIAVRRADRRRVLIAWTACALLSLGLVSAHAAGLWINTTASMPVGLWVTQAQEPVARGADVLLCLPASSVEAMARAHGYLASGPCPTRTIVLIKPIAAVPGDVVKVTPAGISVDGRQVPNSAQLTRDSRGRSLPGYPAGLYRVPPGYFWLISSYNRRSFDSRYFGPVPLSAIRGAVRPWLVRQ